MSRYRIRSLIAAAFAVLSATGPTVARADDTPRRVGVVVTLSVGVEAADLAATIGDLADALIEVVGVDVIAGAEVARRLPPAGLPEECVADAPCRNDLGRRLDADELLMIVVVQTGEQMQIDATWADVASGRTISRPQITLAAGASRADVMREAAPGLLPHIKKDKPEDRIIVVNTGSQEPGREMSPVSWAFAGAGVASLGGGAYFALATRKRAAAFDEDGCEVMVCGADRARTGKRYALYADVLIGVGAAALITSGVLYVLSKPATEAPPVTVSADDESVGVSFSGVF